jgi:hypothetical protein
MQYLPFDDKYELITKLHPLLAVILQQQQSPKQRVAEESIELRLRVKSYQCEFRYKPPNIGGSSKSLLTKEQFMEKIKQWIESLRAKSQIVDKSGDKSFDYLHFRRER